MTTVHAAAETAIFNEEHLKAIGAFKSFSEAYQYVETVINSNSKARPTNIAKARKMLESSRNIFSLQKGCFDFFLAHQGDKVIVTARQAR